MYQSDQGICNYISEAHIPVTAWGTMETLLLPTGIEVIVNKGLHTLSIFSINMCLLLEERKLIKMAH